ncbi:transformer-2 protein homolog alpha isoform X2 [Rhineura floridana]|uniref:transformer-2 protein homolog alpha isoform X2 n=1 Tax=Rhineura floridana TaxID=261503 RepID=UPI002AC83D40|nr:transformer-2 protein homolog alpha isoform X2 [Rhineura floridana]
MSDVEENNFEGRESRSQSKSPAGSPARVKSESRSGSRSPSRASKHSESRSRSRSKSRSRSRRHSHRRYTRSRSHSHRRRSRSRSYTPEYRRRRSRSHSPMSNRRRHTGSRVCSILKKLTRPGRLNEVVLEQERKLEANPDPNTCLGVFGLSLYTTERDLREVFSRYGPLSGVNVVYDQRTGRSRGFAFVYFERIDDSKEAMEHANGMELDGRRIRVDYSITKRAHTPTPGIYMGRPTHGGGGGGGGAGRRRDSYYDRGYDRGYDRYEEYDYRYRRRSPSPYYSRYRSRSRSRSYSPRRY